MYLTETKNFIGLIIKKELMWTFKIFCSYNFIIICTPFKCDRAHSVWSVNRGTHTHINTYTHTRAHIYIHTRAHTHTHTRTHIYTHTHAHAHTHTRNHFVYMQIEKQTSCNIKVSLFIPFLHMCYMHLAVITHSHCKSKWNRVFYGIGCFSARHKKNNNPRLLFKL